MAQYKNGGRPYKVDGKVVGILDKDNNLAYFHSDTPDSPLSNLYSSKDGFNLYYKNHKMSPVKSEGAKPYHFFSVEQVFAFGKALAMHDTENAKNIYSVKPDFAQTHPAVFRTLGRNVKNFDPKVWAKQADVWMKAGMEAKFTQDPFAKKVLKQTANFNLMEANPYDKKWGIGQSIYDDHRFATGQNKQGKNTKEVAKKLGFTSNGNDQYERDKADDLYNEYSPSQNQQNNSGLDMSLSDIYQEASKPKPFIPKGYGQKTDNTLQQNAKAQGQTTHEKAPIEDDGYGDLPF